MHIRGVFRRRRHSPEAAGPEVRERAVARLAPHLGAITIPITDVVLILGVDAIVVAKDFAAAFPAATIHVLSIRPKAKEAVDSLPPNAVFRHINPMQERVDYLAGIPRPQLIFESWPKRQGRSYAGLRHLYWFLPEGGAYALQGIDTHPEWLVDFTGETVHGLLARLAPFVGQGAKEIAEAPKADREMIASTAGLALGDDIAVLTKRKEHLVKLRDGNANEILQRRLGSAWGEAITTREGHEFVSRARVTTHGEGPIETGPQTFAVPALHLRRYNDVTCYPEQIVEREGYLLPDTFRHPLQRTLRNHVLVRSGRYLDRRPDRLAGLPTRRLDGEFFYWDTEFPGHFGHVVTEVVSRYWGWQEAVSRGHDCRPLISLRGTMTAMPTFQRQIFEQLGIPTDDVEYLRPGECVEVESLFAATPAFAMPKYVDPLLEDVWRQIAAHPAEREVAHPTRVFISRRPTPQRSCTNTEEVEAFFERQGFTVLYPEDLDYWTQKDVFAGAELIAGFGGSGLFNIMHAPRAKVIIIAGNSYTATNELLIAAVLGIELHYFWGESEQQQPDGKWTRSAFVSNFSFDLDRHANALTALTEGRTSSG